MQFRYEDLRTYLRHWHNPHNEPGQYDANGLVHLMLAILDNLRQNEDWAGLPEIRNSMTDEQAVFFLKLAGFVRGGQDIATRWPTLGEMLDYLRGLGFTVRAVEGVVYCDLTEEGSSFRFRDRDRNALARPTELMDLKIQLTLRGLQPERDFYRFWHPCLEAPPREAFE